ncbi:MAG: phosphatidate cytidylyltransferase [Methanomicrobiales archaeon]|nr:phosphatidate cytidylyltransferase [Methanomicrobiales archaeon]
MDENLRKLVHLLFGLVISASILLLDPDLLLVILSGSILAGFSLSDAIRRGYRIPVVSQLIDHLERAGEVPGKGALFFALSALVCSILFDRSLVFPGMLTLTVLDGITALVGRNYGKRVIMNEKTLEGSLAGWFAALFVLFLILPPPDAMAATITAGLVELLSPVDDNLTIPIAVCVALFLIRMAVL